MKKTKKMLLGAIVAICVCVSVICGATYALFTSESTVNIAVTSGTVSVTATVGKPTVSVIEGSSVTGANVSAETVGNTVTLDKMTPGDQVDFDITVKNNSTVGVKYRTVIECTEGERLMSGLEITVGKAELRNVRKYTDKYADLADKAVQTVHVTIKLPERGKEIDNRYNGDYTTKLVYTVEAVQGNAASLATEAETEYLHVAFTTEEAQRYLDLAEDNDTIVLAAGHYDKLHFRPSEKSVYHEGGYDAWPNDHACYDRFFNDVTIKGEDGAVVDGFVNDSTLYNTNGFPSADKPVVDDKPGQFSRAGYYFENIAFENLTLREGICFTEGGWAPVEIDGLKVSNCKTADDLDHLANVDKNKLINSRATMTDLVIEHCQVTNRFQGVFIQSATNVTVRNSTFTNTVHNAIAIQDGCKGDIVLESNVVIGAQDRAVRFGNFEEGTITITGNTFINSGDADGEIMKAQAIGDAVVVKIENNYWGDGKIANMPQDSNPATSVADVKLPVAYVADVETLTEALAAGETVALEEDIVLPEAFRLEEGANATLFLNGKTVSYAPAARAVDKSRPIFVEEGAELTIIGGEDGKVVSDADVYGLVENYGTLHMYGGHYETSGGENTGILRLRPGSHTYLHDVSVKATGYMSAVYSDGDCVIDGGTFYTDSSNRKKDYHAYCVQNAGGTMVIDGATVYGIQGGIAAVGGETTINDCLVEVRDPFKKNESDNRSFYALYVNGNHETAHCIINGGTFHAEYRSAVFSNNTTPGDGGECLYDMLEIYGGTFIGGSANGVGKEGLFFNDDEGGDVALYGGTFNSDVSKWTAEGYVTMRASNDGKLYTVVPSAIDFTKPETAVLFCPDCYNGNEHTEHTAHLNIHKGVADVNKEGAWLAYITDVSKETYVLSYDVDLTNLGEGSFVAFDSGEMQAWGDAQLGFTKEGDVYYAHNTVFQNKLGTVNSFALEGKTAHVEVTFAADEAGNLVMTLTVNGRELVTRATTVKAVSVCWNVYTYIANNGETTLCSLSNMQFERIAK